MTDTLQSQHHSHRTATAPCRRNPLCIIIYLKIRQKCWLWQRSYGGEWCGIMLLFLCHLSLDTVKQQMNRWEFVCIHSIHRWQDWQFYLIKFSRRLLGCCAALIDPCQCHLAFDAMMLPLVAIQLSRFLSAWRFLMFSQPQAKGVSEKERRRRGVALLESLKRTTAFQ